MKEENPIVVMDNGSYSCKAGFAGYDAPKILIPTVIGTLKGHCQPIYSSSDRRQHQFVGDEAQKKRSILNLRYPIVRGQITNWDDMESIWWHVLEKDLRTDPQKRDFIVTDSVFTEKRDREKIMQILFETFDVSGLYIGHQEVMGLLTARDHCTGLAVNCGGGFTSVVPVYEMSALHNAQRTQVAGTDLTDYFVGLLNGLGLHFTTRAERDFVRNLKEKLCYVMPRTGPVFYPSSGMNGYEWPELRDVGIDEERHQCPEALFDRRLIGAGVGGIQDLICDTIFSSDLTIQKELASNIVLMGGSSLFPGFRSRLIEEIKECIVKRGKGSEELLPIDVKESCHGLYSAWIGASMLGNISNFYQKCCVRKSEYDEFGSRILVRRKFF